MEAGFSTEFLDLVQIPDEIPNLEISSVSFQDQSVLKLLTSQCETLYKYVNQLEQDMTYSETRELFFRNMKKKELFQNISEFTRFT